MTLKQRYVRSQLKKFGFEIDVSRGEIYATLIVNKKVTCVSSAIGGHSKEKYDDLANGIISTIWKKLHFESKLQFLSYLNGEYTYSKYVRSLLSRKILRFSDSETRQILKKLKDADGSD